MKQASFKYTPKCNKWGKGTQRTLQSVFTSYVKPYPTLEPTKTRGVKDMKYEFWLTKQSKYRNRYAVGMIRAFGVPHFFKGCYVGAEND